MTNQPYDELDRIEAILTEAARITRGGTVSLDNFSELGDFFKHNVPALLELVGEARELVRELVNQTNPLYPDQQRELNHELEGDAA